jgi:hypothetical protein
MSNPNNTPEQKAQWEANKKLVSKFIKTTPAPRYRPTTKVASRRDLHRAIVAMRKVM